MLAAAEYLAATSTRPSLDCPVPRRCEPRPEALAPRSTGGSEHAIGSTSLSATLTTLYLQFEKEAEAVMGLPPNFHSYALLPIGYPMGRFGPVRRVPLADVVYEDRWGQPCHGL